MSEAPTDGPVLLGYRKGGQPIYLIQGGAEPPAFQQPTPSDADQADDTDPADDAPPADPSEGDTDPPDDLGDAGKQAIARMKARVKEEAAKRKAAEARAAALEAKANKAQPDGDEPTPAQIREQARNEARAEMVRDRALDRVEVLAAKTFNDPADARLFLTGQVDEFLDGDQIDTDAINDALADLLKARPYLAAGAPRRWGGTGDGGVRNSKPKDLDSQIEDARARNDIPAFLRLQHQKFQTST